MNNVIEIFNEHLQKPQQEEKLDNVRKNLYQGEKLVSIVVLAYEKVEKTKVCVENIIKYTKGISYQLILVDNGSEKESLLDYFKSIPFDNKIILHIHKNISGIYAINQACKYVNTEFFVLINNDVIVTKNWLHNMLICARSDEKIGMISPVSTNITWEQLEDLGGFSSEEEMQKKAEIFNYSNPRKWEERIRLIPILGFFRTEVFDVVGNFDMGYLHNFGDDDHSFRIRRAGYKLVLCGDTFVHHNHPRTAEYAREIQEELNISRSAFRNKFNGIDAWNDTQNFIAQYLKNISVEDDGNVNILAFETRCGTPILDIKNICSHNRIQVKEICAVTEKIQYYTDLNSISSEVILGTVEEGISKCKERKYSFIYCGKEINLYKSPLETLNNLLKMMKENGYLIFSLKNTFDYKSYLKMIGINQFNDSKYPAQIHYSNVVSYLQSKGLSSIQIYTTPYFIDDDLKVCIEQSLNGIGNENEIKDVCSKMFINTYLFIVKKE